VSTWPLRHLHLPGLAGKVAYAQLLNDASAEANLAQPPDTRTLTLPITRPDVLVPVVALVLT
jgi:alpha-L-fucosidase